MERGDIDLKYQYLNNEKCKHFANREIFCSEDTTYYYLGSEE